MGDKLVIGPINRGLRNDRTPFNIDNDSFPNLINAYQWRGRVKRKRGTAPLGRLQRYLGTTNGAGNLAVTISPQPITSGISSFTIGSDVFVDPGGASPVNLITNSSGTGVLNRATGVLTITGSQATTAVLYFPSLPVMGLEDLNVSATQFPGTLAFDTIYSYNISTANPYPIYDVSFYKNPNNAAYPGYVRKTNSTAVKWNGQDYQQFWTTNYQNALWSTNGINIPYSSTNVGMQFKPIVSVTVATATTATLQITAHGLFIGDFVFVNEVQTTTGINYQTGYVTTVIDANNVIVTFPNANLATNGTGGIAQYLTNNSDVTKDCIRWYDGDPTDGNLTTPALTGNKGWVNFSPPLSQQPFSIGGLPADIYYLVHARIILPFKNRLLFFGPVVQTKSGSPKYLQNVVIYSQDGTAFYTASFQSATDDPRVPDSAPTPILVPDNQTAFPAAYLEDSTGFGGFVSAGIDEQIISVSSNEDVLIVGFSNKSQARLVFTGNDILPFDFYLINSELGTSSTFSAINMDRGVITRGNQGYIITSQTEAKRIDLDNPDQVFEIRLTDNGPERLCAARDYINEWIYFTYPSNQNNTTQYKFPTETFQYNYRDQTWSVFKETFTTYGSFRQQTGFTWQTVGRIYKSWNEWNEPWNSGTSTLLNPKVIAGNQQGFVFTRAIGTSEATSLYIRSFSGSIITCPDHCLNLGDYIQISGCKGTVGAEVNGKIFSVGNVTENTFELNPKINIGTYFGGVLITRMYVPFIQTKQFPAFWQDARKTRIGPQKYLFTKTNTGQITLQIYLSQNDSSPYNIGPLYPDINSINDSLIYTTAVYTCPESTNLGLTPANINLNTPTASQQSQIWHRLNTSLIGDTIQLGFTMNDAQMRAIQTTSRTANITNATQAYPCVLTCNGRFGADSLIQISGINGMTELNGNIYSVITSDATTVTINVDSSGFGAFSSSPNGLATVMELPNQFSEIELHGFILDITPSQLLV